MEEKQRDLLEESIIIDALSHGPILWTEDLIDESERKLNGGMDPWRIVQEIIMTFAHKLVVDDNYFKKYKQAWNQCKVSCVSWTVGPIYEKPYTFEGIFHNFAFLTHLLDNRKDFFRKILRAEDIYQAAEHNQKGIIINLQDLGPIKEDLEMVDLFYMMGIRIMQLTLNTRNSIGTGCLARRDRGLTQFGEEVINRMNQKGIVIDVSHCGPKTTEDAVRASEDPIMATHTSAANIYSHPRAKSDDLIKSIANSGGFIGVLTIQGFISDKFQPLIDEWLDHIDYIINLAGIEHVGIGSDYYGQSLPSKLAKKLDDFLSKLGMGPEHGGSFAYKMNKFEEYQDFPNLIEGLISRGYSTQEIKKISGENFLRIFKDIVG
ncbi:MAG: hypothetical protein GF353_12090 [Candidatus Lokiarchaeota archaeon]|nr:hypothetical protein [Candidatus Lokiarchaeota archaeon]